MAAEGKCPACGHLVIDDSAWEEDDSPKHAAGAPSTAYPPLSSPAAKQPKLPADYVPERTLNIGDGMVHSRDYSALLLGVFIYDLLLLASLYVWFTFFLLRTGRDLVIIIAAACIPLAWAITRLMCTVDGQSGRWIIRNEFLRRIFSWLNALWI